jgi:hypothetical protein
MVIEAFDTETNEVFVFEVEDGRIVSMKKKYEG